MKDVLRRIAITAVFVVPFLPLLVVNELLFPFISAKGFAFRILIEVAVVAWALLALADRRYRPKLSVTLLIYGAFVLWMFVADLFAVNPHKAFWSNYERMDGWITMAHTFLFFLVIGPLLSVEKLWKRWWATVLGGAALVALYGLLQLAGMLPIHQGGARLDASLGNSAYLAAYLLFTIAITLMCALARSGAKRYALFAFAAVQALLVFATATRGALLGLAIAALVGALLFIRSSSATVRKVGIVVVIALVVLGAGFLLVKDTEVIRNDPTLGRIASLSLADGSTRFTLWGMAAKGVAERPITGWGQEGFNYVFAKYYEPTLFEQEPWFDRAHSVYVDWLVAGGIPALLLFFALLISGVVALRKVPAAPERIFLVCAIVAYACQAAFVFDNLFTYVFLAAVLAYAHEHSGKPSRFMERTSELSNHQLSMAAAPASIVLIAVLWVVNVPGIVGGTELIRALSSSTPEGALSHLQASAESGTFGLQEVREQSLSFASGLVQRGDIPLEARQRLLSFGLLEMQDQVALLPSDPRLRLEFATGLEAGGLVKEAIGEISAALALSPRKQLTLLQRGLTYWRSGDRVSAEADFEAAYALNPSYVETAMYRAAGYFITGRPKEAQAFLLERFGTTTLDHEALRYAYADTKRFDDLIESAKLHKANKGNDGASRFALAQSYASAGRYNEARTEIQQMIAAYPEAAAAGAAFLNSLPK